jgi:hypothetical protein
MNMRKLTTESAMSKPWRWADEIILLGHHGLPCVGLKEMIRGFVVYLPHGRFMAGWSMGDTAVQVAGEVFRSAEIAAHAADDLAREAAAEWQQIIQLH